MHLTAPDEYFNHQAAVPHAVVSSSDPNWRERYWLCVQDVRRKDFILTLGLGKYPNRDVMEGFVIAQHGKVQRNLRMSRRLSPQSDMMSVGPLSVEIIEPLRTLRLRLQDNPSGMAFDFTWHAAAASMLEAKHFEVSNSRVTHDLIRYVQLGRAEGTLQLPGESLALSRSDAWAERDHSWGVRPLPRTPAEPPAAPPEWNFLAFCPLQFESFSLHFYLYEAQAGRPVHLSATLMPHDATLAGKHVDDAISSLTHHFEWEPGTAVRTLKSATVTVHFFGGRSMKVELMACAPRVYLKGGGYGVDHGHWKGESHLEHEVWELSETDKLKGRAVSSSDHMVQAHCEGETGFGIIEYIVRRGHVQYGG